MSRLSPDISTSSTVPLGSWNYSLAERKMTLCRSSLSLQPSLFHSAIFFLSPSPSSSSSLSTYIILLSLTLSFFPPSFLPSFFLLPPLLFPTSFQPEEVVRFEVDEMKLAELLSQVEDIEEALQTHSQS